MAIETVFVCYQMRVSGKDKHGLPESRPVNFHYFTSGEATLYFLANEPRGEYGSWTSSLASKRPEKEPNKATSLYHKIISIFRRHN